MDVQNQILAQMSPGKKLELAMRLYNSAKELKTAGIRAYHPDWNEKQVEQAIREAFLYARS